MEWIENFKININEDLTYVGSNLSRPECVLPMRDGSLYVSDNRHAITKILPDGSQQNFGNSGETNGFTMDSKGNIFLADWQANKILKMTSDGNVEVILEELNGEPLGPTNYVYVDSQDRLWVAVSCRRHPWFVAVVVPQNDGHIILIDEKGAREVASGITFTNEIKMDKDEKYLYVAETMARKMSRFPVMEDGTLGDKVTFGPESLGDTHYVDGFSFDSEGNVWVTTILRNGLMIINGQTQEAHTVFENPNEEAVEIARQGLENHTLTPEQMFACCGDTLQLITSVNFGGTDLKTVDIGSLAMDKLVSFKSPIAGLSMNHW